MKFDLHAAGRFLSALGGEDSKFLFVAIHDKKAPGKSLRHLLGTFSGLQDELMRLNKAGYGIFVTVNETKGKGRKVSNISRIRALFVDDDSGLVTPDEAFPPHIKVETSPGKFHYYWLVDSLSLDDFQKLEPALVESLHGDPAAKDAARVLRVPGFFHQKGEPRLVQLLECVDKPRYLQEEVFEALASLLPENQDPLLNMPLPLSDIATVKQAISYIDPDADYDQWRTVGMALKDAFGESALSVWDEWSRTGKSGKYKRSKCEYHWKSFGHKEGKKVGLGSLFYLAKQNGFSWTPTAKTDESPLVWEEPRPLPPLLSPVKHLEPEMIPPSLLGWCLDIAARMQVPLEMVAVPAVAVLSSVVARKISVFPFQGWEVIPNLWSFIIAPPSTGKSSVLRDVVNPLRKYERDAASKTRDAELMMEISTKSIDSKIKKLQKELEGNPSEEKMAELEDELFLLTKKRDGLKPRELRFIVKDFTPEKLQEIMRDNPEGVLLERDELSGLFEIFRRQGREGERQFILECWEGKGEHLTDRIKRGTIRTERLTLSIVGTIQPGKLKRLSYGAIQGDSGADGLLQRFQLVVWVDMTEDWHKVDKAPDQQARESVDRVYSRLIHLNEPLQLRFTKGAQTLFDSWHEALQLRLRSPTMANKEAYQAHLGKYRKLVPALAAIFEAAENENLPDFPLISEPSMKMAITWCEILDSHAQRTYSAEIRLGIEEAYLLAAKISSKALADNTTVRDIVRDGWKGLQSSSTVDAGLRILERAGWLKEVIVKGPTGRPSRVVRINPNLNFAALGFVGFGS